MGKAGKYIRDTFPGIYFFLTGLINSFIRATRPYTIYITDSLGGSFKEYMEQPGLSQKISALKRGLDKESIGTIDVIIQRLSGYPDERNRKRTSRSGKIIGGMLPVEQEPLKKLIEGKLRVLKKELKFPPEHIEESVFYFYHGLALLPYKVIEYIKDQDFIDAGAFIGDSAVALKYFSYRKIYSIEMSLKSIEKYKTYMAENNIPPEQFEIINAGLASGDDEPPVRLWDTGSSGLSFLRKSGKYDEVTVVRKSLDYIVGKYGIHPRFIKVDIEGNSLGFVKGAVKTISGFRPVLSIAIYHNPLEFFEVKPFLEEIVDDYVFIVRKLSTGVKNNLIHSEVILLGYPKESLG